MKLIAKRREPKSLTELRKSKTKDFSPTYEDNCRGDVKDELQRALVAEQRGICCYCMQRIRPDGQSIRVEHWKCQEHHRSRPVK
jgi:hypothetical protein